MTAEQKRGYTALIALLVFVSVLVGVTAAWSSGEPGEFVIATWNIRGYPEKAPAVRQWFRDHLLELRASVVCLQEIANRQKVDLFLREQPDYQKVVFHDSRDSQDNAIFAQAAVGLKALPVPEGFQHPAQAAYVFYRGFDAVVVTVHLSWTDLAKRQAEKALLVKVVQEMLKIDPDVIVVGDFNTTEPDIDGLAASLGLLVMAPQGQAGVGTTHAGHRYDHFLISPDLQSEEAIASYIVLFPEPELANARLTSDHLPVVARFRSDEAFRDRP